MSALKRGFYIKEAEENAALYRKTQPKHHSNIKRKTTIYRYRKPKNRVRRNEKEGKSAANIVQLGNIIA